ncbi:hypothetical protein AB0H43_11695 [Hamadaea sp. NPDC050747]|uniref:hypothetical protein n=1 Tax=Hamadaea sp. NPDC050747 TaxID=3155789 RepID=UPI0033F1F70B
MSVDDDAVLVRLLHRAVADSLTWLGDYPEDQVDPDAVASIRRSVDWVIGGLPAGQRDSLAADDPTPAALTVITGLFADLLWWLDTCADDEVDPHVAVKLQESCAADVDELTDSQRRRLLETLDALAAVEHDDGRRYELRFLPYAIGLVDDEPAMERPAVREWARPEARAGGSAAE